MALSHQAAEQLVDAVANVVRAARSYAHVRHEQLGATGVALAVLRRLAERSGRGGDLACVLGVSPSAVSRAVTHLERLGYVARTLDPADARAHLLAVTASGSAFLAAQQQEHATRVAAALDGWDDTKAGLIVDGLADLEAALSRAVTDMRTGATRALTTLETFADSAAGDTDTDSTEKDHLTA